MRFRAAVQKEDGGVGRLAVGPREQGVNGAGRPRHVHVDETRAGRRQPSLRGHDNRAVQVEHLRGTHA